MADFLDTKRKEIEDRLRELRPLVQEFHRLEQASSALSGVGESPRRGPGRPRGTASATKSRRRTASTRGGRRRRGGGTRANQALELVRSRPGITIPELAEAMKIKQNYLYRVMPRLASDGAVKKQGRGWHAPADATG